MEKQKIYVWDRFVRLFHWTVVFCCLGAGLFEDPEWLHKIFGYTVMIMIALRCVWGIIGTKYARFRDFVPTPQKLITYVKQIMKGNEPRYIGHNPAGGAMVIALLLTLFAITASGYMMGMDRYFGAEWVEEFHEGAFSVLLVLVALHVTGVVYESLKHRESLVLAMMTGFKKNRGASKR